MQCKYRPPSVTLTHTPTGLRARVVASRIKDLKSAEVLARKILTARVWAAGQERPAGPIRSYVFCPYQAVTDMRNGRRLMASPSDFLDGNLDPLLKLAAIPRDGQ